MTFEQRYGACPPYYADSVMSIRDRAHWRDRKAVWIKSQMEMRERCATLVASWFPQQDCDLEDIDNLADDIRALEVA
jgi:hypothetical protein